MSNELPPCRADFEAALSRIESGLATAEDAALIHQYVADMEEGMNYLLDLLRRERESSNRLQRALEEAFNSGSGAYIP